jgi:integrating conjugative element protein (TIGR03759 family)
MILRPRCSLAVASVRRPAPPRSGPGDELAHGAQAQVQPGADAALDETQARDWGLRSEEWARYRQLMQGPLGVYSPQLDPLTALGIEARSEEERRRYAELQVQAEARRVGKTLAYQRAYDAAWQRLFPGQPRVSLPGAKAQGAGNTGSGRLAVFVKADCAPCAQRVQQLQAAGTAFDLYMVGSRQDDARIRQWATQAGIDPARVRARTITLNHDAGRWLSLGLPGDLPAVVREVNGNGSGNRCSGRERRLSASPSAAPAPRCCSPPGAGRWPCWRGKCRRRPINWRRIVPTCRRRCCTRWPCRRAAPGCAGA